MKERIVIEDKEVSKVCEDCGEYLEGCIMKENCKNKNTFGQTECCFNFRFTPKFKIEKYPTTWEELKELCKDLESKNVFIINAGNCIEFNGLYFWKDGSITTTQNNNDIWATKTNLTPARQWQIIKSLIGEE